MFGCSQSYGVIVGFSTNAKHPSAITRVLL